MSQSKDLGLYSSYGQYKDYHVPRLSQKQIIRFESEIWNPASFSKDMSCLEIGSGTGEFLSFLAHKGVSKFHGIDLDPSLLIVQPDAVRSRFEVCDVWAYLARDTAQRFDRVIMLDVLEHFAVHKAQRLIGELLERLNAGGKIIVRVPNAASPWGLGYQYGDLTHETPFSAASLRQLAIASGGRVEKIYPQRQGTRRRLVTDAVVNRLLSWAILNPPELWSANIYAVISRSD